MRKPLRIFQHEACGGLGYLDIFLAERDIAHEVIHIGKGESVPPTTDDVSGLIFLGSSHSVNDGNKWIEDELALVRQASCVGLPVLGICFGAQLISRAMGGEVVKASTMQAGWFEVKLSTQAKHQFGDALGDTVEVFEWHDDECALPTGATPFFFGNCVRNQGFMHGRSLALQFHPDFTRNKIEGCLSRNPDLHNNLSACVQQADQMLNNLDDRLIRLHALADVLFSWWLKRDNELSPLAGADNKQHSLYA